MKILYTAKAEAKGGGDGHFKVLDGKFRGRTCDAQKAWAAPAVPPLIPSNFLPQATLLAPRALAEHVAMKEKKTIEAPIVTAASLPWEQRRTAVSVWLPS
jgi:hypothetical protein